MHQERLIPYSYARNHGIIALTNPSDPTFIQVFHLPQTPNQILLEIQRFLDTDKLEFHCIQEEIFSQNYQTSTKIKVLLQVIKIG